MWEVRCGGRPVRKAGRDGKAWRILEADADLALLGVCDRCAVP